MRCFLTTLAMQRPRVSSPPMTSKYWELMRLCLRARGLKVFDYGRSKLNTGSYAFKKNWGFEPTPLHHEYQLYKTDSVPQNNPRECQVSVADRHLAPHADSAGQLARPRSCNLG